jgi:hypothetical protein
MKCKEYRKKINLNRRKINEVKPITKDIITHLNEIAKQVFTRNCFSKILERISGQDYELILPDN